MIAKPISINDAKRKFGGCALKAVELISGDLLHVSDSCLMVKRFILTLQQKGWHCASQSASAELYRFRRR